MSVRVNLKRVVVDFALMLVLLGMSALVVAGKVYKIVDSEGNITYTDIPPIENVSQNLTHTMEQLDIQEDSINRTSITRLGNSEFCGQLKMPAERNSRRENYFEYVSSSRKNWEQQLRNMEKRINEVARNQSYRRYNSTNYNDLVSPENIEKMRDYRCAIQWASDTERSLSNEKEELLKKSTHQNELIVSLERRMLSACGSEPEFGTPQLDQRRKEWRQCTADYSRQIREGKAALRETDSKLSAIQRADR